MSLTFTSFLFPDFPSFRTALHGRFFFLLLSWKAFRLPLLLSFPSFFLYFQCFSGFFPFFFWKSGTTKERLFCFVSGSLFFCLKRKREKKQRGTGLMSCPLCFWKAEKGAFCSRWDDENDAVGMGTIALFRVHILFKKSSKFFYTIHTISSCFMDII